MILLTIKYAWVNSKRLYKSYKKAIIDFENIINDIQSKGRWIKKIQDWLCMITSKSWQYELWNVFLESVIFID
jgi:hypothetical protein